MKEATGEVSMTVITLVALGVIAAIIGVMWPSIENKIKGLWDQEASTTHRPATMP